MRWGGEFINFNMCVPERLCIDWEWVSEWESVWWRKCKNLCLCFWVGDRERLNDQRKVCWWKGERGRGREIERERERKNWTFRMKREETSWKYFAKEMRVWTKRHLPWAFCSTFVSKLLNSLKINWIYGNALKPTVNLGILNDLLLTVWHYYY